MEVMFGGTSTTTLNRWFHLVVDFIYRTSLVLIRSRNLGNPINLRAVLEEMHGGSMRNTRFSASFTPTMREVERRNPHLGTLKLCGVIWDSRAIKTEHSISFPFQRRSFSTKISDNAIVELAACGMDSLKKFVYMTTASISPVNADEAMASYLIDMETNQGKLIKSNPLLDCMHRCQLATFSKCSK